MSNLFPHRRNIEIKDNNYDEYVKSRNNNNNNTKPERSSKERAKRQNYNNHFQRKYQSKPKKYRNPAELFIIVIAITILAGIAVIMIK